MTHGGSDLTPAIQNGLGWFYVVVALANFGYGLCNQFHFKKQVQAFIWYAVGLAALILAALNFAHVPVLLPQWFRELMDHGINRAFIAMGMTGGIADTLFLFSFVALILVIVALLTDLLWSYWIGPKTAALNGNRVNGNGTTGGETGLASPINRITLLLLLISVLSLLLYGMNAISYFVLSIAGFMAFIVWRKTLTEPNIIWTIFNLGLLFGGLSMTDANFREIIVKPDNVPIVGLVFVVGFFTWLAFRKAVINDDRMAQGLPPTEKLDDDKVLVWPDLVYTELICMVVLTIILVVWSIVLPAPLEQPASSTKTPNPSKAPWYFLGLQEMLVYYDPWMAGVVLPTFIIIGLIALPYIDFNQKGNGYFTFVQRQFSIITFLIGFIVLWVTLIFLGTFLRGPNWNFYGLYEPWDPHKLVPLNNVNLSDYFWIRGLNMVWHPPTDDPLKFVGVILIRELPGILLVLAYFLILPPLLARTVFRSFFIKMGFIRYITLVTLLLFMASLPIKMILRWTINLKYIVAIPEYFFNI